MAESVALRELPLARGAEPPAPAPAPVALTRRASLNAVAALVDYAGQILAGLLVTPVLVRGLGPALFGSWEMLVRLGGYVSATDGRPTEALRLVVARMQGAADASRRRMVGAAIGVWALLLPVVLVLGTALVVAAPTFVGAGPERAEEIRLAAALLVGAMLLGALASVPESVLRGMNLGYTRMGLQASLHLFGALLAAGAIWSGLGVAGLGGATFLRGIVTGVCFWLLVRRRVPWFGVERPARREVRQLLGMSLWLSAGELLARFLLASDVLILGTLVSPAAVTTYVLSGYAARVAIGVHVFTAGEAMPGIGSLLGEERYARARRARRELLTLTWLYTTVAATTVVLWNPAFLAQWVGAEHHAGALVDLLIVLLAAQTAFIRLDAGVIDAALRPRQRVLVAAVAAVVAIAAAITLTWWWGMPGLCIGILVGRGVQSIAYPMLVARALRAGSPAVATESDGGAAIRAAATSALLLGTAALLAPRLAPAGWGAFALGVATTVAATALLAFTIGLPPSAREALWRRLRALRARDPQA